MGWYRTLRGWLDKLENTSATVGTDPVGFSVSGQQVWAVMGIAVGLAALAAAAAWTLRKLDNRRRRCDKTSEHGNTQPICPFTQRYFNTIGRPGYQRIQ